jgi:hypothetical protein
VHFLVTLVFLVVNLHFPITIGSPNEGKSVRTSSPIFLAISIAAASLLLTGCDQPIAGKQDPVVVPPQIHVTSHALSDDLYFQKPVVQRVGAGQVDVSVPVYNRDGDEKLVDFQYRFLFNGAESEQPSGWQMLRIPPRGWAQIHFTSMTAVPNDFDVNVRPMQ